MIENIVSISTLMICTFLSTMVVGIFMLQVWLTDRRHAAAGYWCLSMWVGSLCTLLYAMRPMGYPMLTVGIGRDDQRGENDAVVHVLGDGGYEEITKAPQHRPRRHDQRRGRAPLEDAKAGPHQGIAKEVAALTILSEGREIGVSVSIGLADVATFGADFDRLHSAADGALYAAKEAGRNRVVRAAPAAVLSGFAERMCKPAARPTGVAVAG